MIKSKRLTPALESNTESIGLVKNSPSTPPITTLVMITGRKAFTRMYGFTALK